MSCPSGLHGAVWCSCPAPHKEDPDRLAYQAARLRKQFFQDVSAESVIRDYEYRHDVPKFWTGWHYERGHKCENGEIRAGVGDCLKCY